MTTSDPSSIHPRPRPEPPVAPELDDCCRSGCAPCVFDLYEEALTRYQLALAQWEAEQAPGPGKQQENPPHTEHS
jgi:hypothetical protein